jgi:hypothetical protein
VATIEAESNTQKTLRGGVVPHKLTDEDRRKSAEIRAQKRAEAQEQYRIEQLIPKSWRVQNRHLTSRKTPPAVAQKAAEFVWENVHGKATQRVETTDTTQNPFAGLTPEAMAVLLAQVQAHRAQLEQQAQLPPSA